MSLAKRSATFFGQVAEAFKKWNFNASGYNKYGLLYDDIIFETPQVEEAIKRMPSKLQQERVYRILRAVQLSIQNDYLPKDQWTKYEEYLWN